MVYLETPANPTNSLIDIAMCRRIADHLQKEKQEKVVHNLADLALLSQGLLKGNSLTNFINRSVELIS